MLKNDLLKNLIAIIISIILIIIGSFANSIVSVDNVKIFEMIFFGLAFIIGGLAKAKEGLEKTIENKALNVEFLMIVAALAAYILGDYFEGAILILIFAISGLLEEYVESKSAKTLTDLLELTPQQANLLKDNKEVLVDASSLDVGDIVVVKVGEQFPADGVIHSGKTNVDQAIITGESEHVLKSVGDKVYAGSINQLSNVLVEVDISPKESLAEKISTFVVEAQNSKTKEETFINDTEKYYVYSIIVLGILTMILPPLFKIWDWNTSIYRGVMVFVIASPCALVASITPAVLSSMSYAVRNQTLLKGGTPLMNLNKIDVVIFDKTGTITEGKPQFVDIFIDDNYDYDEVVNNLCLMESQSTHPLAVAIVNHFNLDLSEKNVETKEIAGKGLESNINGKIWKIGNFPFKTNLFDDKIKEYKKSAHSIVNIIVDDVLVGFVALKDEVKEHAKEVVQFLKSQNIETVLLTGDHENIAENIANELGFDSYIANTLPMEKSDQVMKYQKAGKKVLMIGDGINDAPALSISDISVAMGSGADVSMEAADLVIINSRLDMIPNLFLLSKKMKRIIIENIVFSISVIVMLLIFNFLNLDNFDLSIGVVAHEGSTILVILNSLRLLINKKYFK